jgi:hypothetical protein
MLATPMDADLFVRAAAGLAGVVLVAAAATDAVSTLVTTQRPSGRWWPTYVFYRRTWWLWRAMARHIGSEQARERLLAVYGPLSLLGLLVVWVLLLPPWSSATCRPCSGPTAAARSSS